MLAYSQPITPAPITASVRGSSSSCIMSSLEKMQIAVSGVRLSRAAWVPTASTILAAEIRSLHAARFIFEMEHVRIDEARARGGQLDAVAQKLMAQDVDLVAHDRIDAHQQVLEGDFFLDLVRIAVDRVFAIAGEIEDGLAHRLARNRADVDADAAEDRLALDHDDALAQLGALDGRMMSGWTGAYDREIEIKIRHRQ